MLLVDILPKIYESMSIFISFALLLLIFWVFGEFIRFLFGRKRD